MSTLPFTSARYRALDANGNPLAGGKLYTYAAGTTTPLATYTTRAGTIANANPVVLDADGEADVWLTPAVDYKFVLKDSADVVQSTVDNWPVPSESSASTDQVGNDPGGRLTLTSGTPVTTADVTAATTVYYVPYKNSKVPLYDGSTWALYDIGDSGLSQTTGDTTKSPAAVAVNSLYDLFVWNDSGTLRLSRGPAWSTTTSRGTGAGTTDLVRVNGRLVNAVSISNGPAAQRGLYVGTIGSDGSAQLYDSAAQRFVWNMYNRGRRSMRGALETTSAWNYTTFTYRQANANTANQLAFVRGLDEDEVEATVLGSSLSSLLGNQNTVAVGLDSTSTPASGCLIAYALNAANLYVSLVATWRGFPGLGKHTLVWLERAEASGTTSWKGDNHSGSASMQSGIHGSMLG